MEGSGGLSISRRKKRKRVERKGKREREREREQLLTKRKRKKRRKREREARRGPGPKYVEGGLNKGGSFGVYVRRGHKSRGDAGPARYRRSKMRSKNCRQFELLIRTMRESSSSA